MKKLFDHFNEIDINLDEFEEMEVSEFEKAQAKKNFSSHIKNRSTQKWKKGLAASCLALGIGATSLVGLSYTTFAQEIPFVNSIFKLFSEEKHGTTLGAYDQYADVQNLVVESNGTTITITEALLDSKKFFISYTIETNKDLGDFALVEGNFNVNGGNLFNTEHSIKKISPNTYAGMTTAILPLKQSIDEGTLQFNLKKLYHPESGASIEGEWNFDIFAKAPETSIQIVDVPKSEKDDLYVEINEITYTPYSFILNYKEGVLNEALNKQYEIIYADLLVKDDLGNTYKSKFNGGIGTSGVTDYMITFGQLHPDAKTLIFTPVFQFKNEDDIFTILESMQLDDIIVEIKR